jgi:hypothetical protein
LALSTDGSATLYSKDNGSKELAELGDCPRPAEATDLQQETQDDLKSTKLPNKRQSRAIRSIRHTLWNVYRRLFSIVFTANAIALIIYLARAPSVIEIDIWNLATAASANIFVATTIRQDYVQGIIYQTTKITSHRS